MKVRTTSDLFVAMACIMVGLVLGTGGCEEPRRTKEELLRTTEPEMREILEAPGSVTTSMSTPLMVAGIENPTMVSAADSGLKPDAAVIGVIVDGQARAYPLLRLSGMLDHVVNDVVKSGDGGKRLGLTITYCDITDCIRVLTAEGERSEESLRVGTLGLVRGGLGITVGSGQYKQTEKIEGLEDYPHERTTWLDWRFRHPQTVVYAGVAGRFTSVEKNSRGGSESR